MSLGVPKHLFEYALEMTPSAVADPGFPVGGGRGPRTGDRGPPRWLRFKNFACQNERIWTRRGGRAPGAPPPRSANALGTFTFSLKYYFTL